MNLDDQLQAFLVKQNAIVQQYQDSSKLLADRLFVLNESVRKAQGPSVIDGGNLLAKGQLFSTLTNLPSMGFPFFQTLNVLRLSLGGARKLKLQGQATIDNSGDNYIWTPSGIMAFLSTDAGWNPQINDFSASGETQIAMTVDDGALADVTLGSLSSYGEIECASATFAYLIFPLFGQYDGFASTNGLPVQAQSSYQLIG